MVGAVVVGSEKYFYETDGFESVAVAEGYYYFEQETEAAAFGPELDLMEECD